MTDVSTTASGGLKQRLVGAFVVLSLAIIFLPMIFDEPHRLPDVPPHIEVPPTPESETVTISQPDKPEFEVMALDESDQRVKSVSEIVPAATEGKVSEVEQMATAPEHKSAQEESVQKELTAKEPSQVEANSSKKLNNPEVSNLPVFKNVWMLQLGTFSSEPNAYALRDQMRKDGFDAHTKKVMIGSSNVIRVFSGPFVNRSEAERVKKKIDQRYKVNSMIVFLDA